MKEALIWNHHTGAFNLIEEDMAFAMLRIGNTEGFNRITTRIPGIRSIIIRQNSPGRCTVEITDGVKTLTAVSGRVEAKKLAERLRKWTKGRSPVFNVKKSGQLVPVAA